jgi:hypothetical protein
MNTTAAISPLRDDRQIDAAQIEQRIEVLRGAARDDGQDEQVGPVIDDAGHLRRQTQWCTLDQAGSEADRPGIYLVLLLGVGRRTSGRLILRLGHFRAKRKNNRGPQRKCAQ